MIIGNWCIKDISIEDINDHTKFNKSFDIFQILLYLNFIYASLLFSKQRLRKIKLNFIEQDNIKMNYNLFLPIVRYKFNP